MDNALFKERGRLIRQIISAWLILPLSVIVFVVTALIISIFVQNRELVILYSFCLVSPLIILANFILYKNNYRLEKKSTKEQNGDSQINTKSSANRMQPDAFEVRGDFVVHTQSFNVSNSEEHDLFERQDYNLVKNIDSTAHKIILLSSFFSMIIFLLIITANVLQVESLKVALFRYICTVVVVGNFIALLSSLIAITPKTIQIQKDDLNQVKNARFNLISTKVWLVRASLLSFAISSLAFTFLIILQIFSP